MANFTTATQVLVRAVNTELAAAQTPVLVSFTINTATGEVSPG